MGDTGDFDRLVSDGDVTVLRILDFYTVFGHMCSNTDRLGDCSASDSLEFESDTKHSEKYERIARVEWISPSEIGNFRYVVVVGVGYFSM